MRQEIEFLKERGSEFWERAYEDLEKARFNLCFLDIEQAIQLWLKYLILIKAGDFPKTHYLTELIEDVINIYGLKGLDKFYQENILSIRNLEDAYITSRYLPKRFSQKEAEAALEFAIKFVRCLENETVNKFI